MIYLQCERYRFSNAAVIVRFRAELRDQAVPHSGIDGFRLALLILLRATALFLVQVGVLFGLIFADADPFAGHIARIVLERSWVLFARLLLVRIPVVGHGTPLGLIPYANDIKRG
jgi:hypothetical protein